MAKEFVEFYLQEDGVAVPGGHIDWLDRALEMNRKLGEARSVSGVLHYAGQCVIAQQMLLANEVGIPMSSAEPLDHYEPRNPKTKKEIFVNNFREPLFNGQLYYANYEMSRRGEVSLRTLKVAHILRPAPKHIASIKMRLDEEVWSPASLGFPAGGTDSYAEFRLQTPAGDLYGANLQTPVTENGAWDSFRLAAALALGSNLSRFC